MEGQEVDWKRLVQFALLGSSDLEQHAILLVRVSLGLFFAISGANRLFIACSLADQCSDRRRILKKYEAIPPPCGRHERTCRVVRRIDFLRYANAQCNASRLSEGETFSVQSATIMPNLQREVYMSDEKTVITEPRPGVDLATSQGKRFSSPPCPKTSTGSPSRLSHLR
jgi:hypothetical protein